jgi:excinuclease ABC subunit C
VEALTDQDDYASMAQVVRRRFSHFKDGDTGFETAPDLLLIDGGIAHARVAVEALEQLSLRMNVFGMVKDDRHRTRALVTPEGQEIAIDSNQAVFSFIGTIQEETHRFAITFHRQLRSKRLRYSELDGIEGIGPKRKEQLLKHFKSLTAIGQASLPELERLLPKDAASAVYHHFHDQEE